MLDEALQLHGGDWRRGDGQQHTVGSQPRKEGKSMAISEFSKELEAELRSLNEK